MGNEVIVKAKQADGVFRSLTVDSSDKLFTTDTTTTAAITATTGTTASTIATTDSAKRSRIVNDFNLDVATGLFTGKAVARKFGANGTVGTTEEIIWSDSGVYAGFLSTAVAVRIKAGGDVADSGNSGGAGCREVTVSGLDETWTEATETITTDGATVSAATTITFIRVNRLFVSSSGTYSASGLGGTNEADITVETTGGVDLATIPAKDGQTTIGFYTVPVGKTLYVDEVIIGVAGLKPATVKMFQRLDADDTTVPVQGRRLVSNFGELSGNVVIPYKYTISFPEKTDIIFTGMAATGSSKVFVEWYSILVDN